MGTVVLPHDRDLPARKLWIAFAVGSAGTVVVDAGRPAARSSGAACRCCRPAWSTSRATFDADDAVEIADPDGARVRQGPRAAVGRRRAATVAGRRSAELPDGVPRYLVHADDLVILP